MAPPRPGQRVMLRYRLSNDRAMTDVLGTLESLDPVAVRSADGVVTTVEIGRVVALKAIPPPPVSRAAVRNLEHAAALAWPGLEQEWLGGWLVRAGGGFTGRANSALPLGEPPSGDAVARVSAWYAARGLPARFQVPDRLRVPLPGWRCSDEVEVLTADAAAVAGAPVTVHEAPDEEWLGGYHYRGGALPAAAPGVLAAVLGGVLGFGGITGDGGVQAIARGAVTAAPDGTRWLGLTAVEVDPAASRQGLGTAICAGMATWGLRHGAQRIYVQVAADNQPALALYRRLGFTPHHRYRYAVEVGR